DIRIDINSPVLYRYCVIAKFDQDIARDLYTVFAIAIGDETGYLFIGNRQLAGVDNQARKLQGIRVSKSYTAMTYGKIDRFVPSPVYQKRKICESYLETAERIVGCPRRCRSLTARPITRGRSPARIPG